MAAVSLAALFLFACKDEEAAAPGQAPQKPAAPPPPDIHTVVYGGNVTFAGDMNSPLLSEKTHAELFGDVAPLLRDADLALINGEGVISRGGSFAIGAEPIQEMHRIHPRMVEVLVQTGIDVVSVGNDHSGDYGPAAFREMLDRFSRADISYTGGGHTARDARQPVYRRIGDTVIAVVGADLTGSNAGSTPDNPGALVLSDAYRGKDEDITTAALAKILNTARRHAHVVLFTPHWGKSETDRPSTAMRRLAARLIAAGYDGILGHGTGRLHGVELIDGRPVIYDAGNLLINSGGTDDSHRAVLWKLAVTQSGVVEINGLPLLLKKNKTTLAPKRGRDEILASLRQRSQRLGTPLSMQAGMAVLRCSPGKNESPAAPSTLPQRSTIDEIRTAPSDTIIDRLPANATRVSIEYDNGIRLLGYRTLLQELSIPYGVQVVALYWTATERPVKSYRLHLETRGHHPVTGKPKAVSIRQIPGDWSLPTTEWPPDKIIQSWTLLRFKLKPEGAVDFYAGLSAGEIISPRKTNVKLVDDRLLHLGRAVYSREAKKLSDVWRNFRRGITAPSNGDAPILLGQ